MRSSSPAPNSRNTAVATSPMTSRLRSRPPLPVVVRVSDPITSAVENAVAFHAGMTPKSNPTNSAAPAQNATTRPSNVSETLAGSRPSGIDGWRHTQNRGADPRAERATNQRQHDALGHQLPHDAQASRPERRADRELAHPKRRTRQQQVGDVGAANQQHESDDTQEQHRSEPQIGADDRIVQPLERDAPAFVRLRELARQAVGDSSRSASAASIDTPGFSRPTTCSTYAARARGGRLTTDRIAQMLLCPIS